MAFNVFYWVLAKYYRGEDGVIRDRKKKEKKKKKPWKTEPLFLLTVDLLGKILQIQ